MWILRLQSFRYRVVYRKGSTNLADPLSLLSHSDPEPFDEDSEVYINEIKSSAAIDISEIEVATEDDEELQILN